MTRRLPLLFLALLGCAGSEPVAPTVRPAPAAPGAAAPSAVRTIDLMGSVANAYPGVRFTLQIAAKDQSGVPVGTADARITVDNPAVAAVSATRVYDVVYAPTRRVGELFADVIVLAPGTTQVRVTLGDVTVATTIVSVGVSPGPASLVVTSFKVVEHRASCAWACPYLVYSPVLELTERSGTTGAVVVGVEFTIPGSTTGHCRGLVGFSPGSTAQLVGFDPYLWNNDLILVRLDGSPAPEGPARARVWVQSDSTVRLLEATGHIERMGNASALPPLSSWWQC